MEAHLVTEAPAHTSSRTFWWHFVAMVVVMLVSMVAFGALVSMLFAVLGHSNLLHYAALRGLLMTAYMVVGMVVWMRHRHHNWASIIEMSTAMLLPYVLLVGPLAVGWIGKATFLASMHALMLPLMLVAMLLRRGEYSESHRVHGVLTT